MINIDYLYINSWLFRNCICRAVILILFSGVNQIVFSQDNNNSAAVSGDVIPSDASGYVGEIYKIGLGWHPTALQDFPKDKYGLVDWVQIIDRKLINPRGNLDAKAEEIPPFDMDITMPSKTGLIEGAYFPHDTHTLWMACESCHTKIFMPVAGGNDLNMSRIVGGEACGVCHGKVAFPLNDCERCHVPESTVGEVKTADN